MVSAFFLLLVFFVVFRQNLAGMKETIWRVLGDSSFAALLLMLSESSCRRVGVDRQTVVVVVGAAGEEQYGQQFQEWAVRWRQAAEKAEAHYVEIGGKPESTESDKNRLRAALEASAKESLEPLWLVLIGHGTFDGRSAKFNLQGSDLSATDLAEWLKPFRRPLAVVNCASASGPFVNQLSGAGRVIVTATKSGQEQNFAQFGEHVSRTIADASADLDKDGQTSLLEAFVAASSRVDEYYDQQGRLASEHALIDDNGDALGTPANWFRGVRATRTSKSGTLPDGLLAHQFCLVRSALERNIPPELRVQRDALELEMARLREKKSELPEDEYYALLEPLLLKLAELYRDIVRSGFATASRRPRFVWHGIDCLTPSGSSQR